MIRPGALWRSPLNRQAAKVAAVAAVAGSAIFFAASLPAALTASNRVTTVSDDRLLDILREEQQTPGTIQSQALVESARDHPPTWFVPAGGAPEPVDAAAPPLPADLAAAGQPETATIAGVRFRVAGTAVRGGRLVAAVLYFSNLRESDGRLRSVLAAASPRFDAASGPPAPTVPRKPRDELAWRVSPDGGVTPLTGPATPGLPERLRDVELPTAVVIDGIAYRIAGASVPGGRAVVALPDLLPEESAVNQQLPLVALVGLAVFVVAFAIGRWAAAPIEEVRRRQLEFTADASHELRTPLAVIEAEVSLALGRPREAERYREALVRVLTECRRLALLVDGLLWLARLDAGPPGPRSHRVDVWASARAAVERFRPVGAARGQVLEMPGYPVDGAWISAPAEWLDKLLGVLLDNACRYSPAGGAVGVRVLVAAGNVTLVVDDSGPGIPAGERQRIFERFHRSTVRPGGAGLGLSIADMVVRATRGHWEIGRSTLGGARMSVTWAVARRLHESVSPPP